MTYTPDVVCSAYCSVLPLNPPCNSVYLLLTSGIAGADPGFGQGGGGPASEAESC